MAHWVDSVFDTMSSDERIGQLFMVIANPESSPRNMQRLMRYVNEIKIGGILFHKGAPATQAAITNRLQKASHVPMWVSLDGEWGLSMRLSGTTRFPKNMMLGAIEDNRLIERYGEEVGRQCREMGIQINFAPDIDINSNVDNPVIGLRSFGETPRAVAEKGIAYARGLERSGILSVAKHFPGHGDTSEDSHETLPAIHHSRARLDSIELVPFREYIQAGFGGMMTAHLYVPSLDRKQRRPVSLSKAVVTDLLQKELGFRGLCFTDALAMKGATTRKSDNPAVLALLAGNDVLLAPAAPLTDFQAVKEAVETGILPMELIEAKCIKILQYKYILGLDHYRPTQLEGLSQRLNDPHAAWLAAKLNEEALTLLKNQDSCIPLKQLAGKRIAALSIGDDTENDFQEMLCRYDKVDRFSIGRRTPAAQVQQVYRQLERYDLILCGIHTVRIPESHALRQLAARKPVVLTFFTIPYFCKEYKQTIGRAKAVLLAYEGTPLAQSGAAQLLFGGIGAKGKLPVTIPTLYYAGTGIFTEQTRLGYREPEEVGADAERLAQIQTIAREGISQGAYPGCQILVAKEGQIIFHESFGNYTYKSHRPVTESSVYDLASASKAAGTLPAVMKAYDEKRFTLNDKIADLLPELKGSNKQNITVKELLYHQSGLVPGIYFVRKAKGLIAEERKPGFNREIARDMYIHDSFRDSLLLSIKNSRLGAKKYSYSDINFILLQMMVEKLTHQRMDSLLDADFFAPLGAWHTTYTPLQRMDTAEVVPTEEDTSFRHQLLQGYVHDESAALQGGISGNAGLFSNANDLAKLLQMYLNEGTYGGERYLSAETVRLFTQSKSPISRRGLGFDKPAPGNPKGSPCCPQAPASTYGHTGFTGTCFWVDPENQLIYIFLSNRVYPTRENRKLSTLHIRTRIQEAIYKAIIR